MVPEDKEILFGRNPARISENDVAYIKMYSVSNISLSQCFVQSDRMLECGVQRSCVLEARDEIQVCECKKRISKRSTVK
jgi:hypothetical protein